MSLIELHDLTKDYGEKKGIFNLNLNIEKGEMVGFVGTNGSGKTTTIRNILGFIKPTSGSVFVNGLSSWEH
ncbi:MAG: ATP-binding cassette domain-containing protein, partial [Bacilli bacterium]|nr:ATP-binding cassette domain-containing protein [Bacilli bacterium]